MKDLVLFNNLELLSQPAKKVGFPFTTNEISTISSMYYYLLSLNALGISAVQVGNPIAMFLMHSKDKEPHLVINPNILSYRSEILCVEGCLSFPNLYIETKRYNSIYVSYYDINHNKKERALIGEEAIIFQHEYDHIEGKTFLESATAVGMETFTKYKKENDNLL